ncbi:MAG: U32 family peptidase [Bacilli bacterium]|nr:U32 family peptidase [Bacilli bacterium]
MKLLVVPKSLDRLDNYIKQGCSGFIFGMKDLSINYDLELSIDEISNIIKKYSNIDIFISMNKNMFNDDLEKVESTLKELDKLKIKGVLFYDLGLIFIKKKLGLKVDLVWNQTHMVTNYNTCNYYKSMGVNYAYLAPEITLDEINEIKEKTDMSLISFAFGYPVMADSRRSLLTNYFKSNNIKPSKEIEVYDKDSNFIIKEGVHGTSFYNKKIMNGTSLITNSNIDYIVFNDFYIDEDTAYELTKNICLLIDTKDKEYIDKISSLIGDDTNFLFKKTIYMVKKNEK